MASVFTIFRLDFGAVPTVWCFVVFHLIALYLYICKTGCYKQYDLKTIYLR